MKKYHFKIKLFLLIFLLFFSPVVLAEDTILPVKVGVFQLSPLIDIDDAGSPHGVFVDVIEAIADEEGLKIEFIKGTWSEGLERVKSGQIDLMTAVMHLSRRESFLDFPKESVFNIWGQIYTHKDSNIPGIFDLEGKTVGILKGGANGENFINLTNKLSIQCKVISLDSQKEIAEAISKKNVDAGVFTNIHGYKYQQSHNLKQTQIVFDPSYLKFATTEGANQQLLSTIDNYLSRWKRDRNSVYYTIIEKHLGISKSKKIPEWVWWVVIVGAGILVVMLIYSLILLTFNKKLTTMVEKKTLELISANKKLSKNENRLKKSEEKYRELIEGTQDLVTRTDENGNFTFINHAAEEILGLSPEECIGRSAFDFIHPDDRERTIEWFNEGVAKKKKEMKIENRQVNVRTGESRTLLWSVSFHFDKSGLMTGVGGIARDVTERKRAEEALRESERRLNAILESSPDPVVVYDTKGTPHYLNPSFTNSFGWNLNELKGKRIPFVPEDQKTISASKIDELYRFSKPVTFLSRRLTKHGNILDVIISAAIIKDSEENPAGMVVNLTDITKQKILETQLQQAQKMESVGRLAGGVAHDFNNMLSIIMGNTELILDDIGEENPIIEKVKEILKAANRSADFTRQLLAFARKQTIAPKVLDLNETLEGMLKMLRRLMGEDIDFSWKPKMGLWAVKIDSSQIDQLLANLCVNARDAIKSVGKVTIETDNINFDEEYCLKNKDFKVGNYVMIAVSDNGCGMDKETLDNIFEPFFTTKETGKGTGLGLATVYGIIKQNYGFINVYSEPKQGTTFKMYLPRYTGKIAEGRNNIPKKDIAVGDETILIVEDEKSILEMSVSMLKDFGYNVLPALNPIDAINISKSYSGKIHLLLTDVVMPDMNGRDLSKELLNYFPDIKCLFMSGYTANVIAHHGVLDEGTQFIQKPFSKHDLSIKVRSVLDE